MTARLKSKDINLLPKNKWETGILGKLFKWVLNAGRYVVVFTELIVISAFLFRFGLDRKLTDLNEETSQKKAVVAGYGDLESKFTRIQEQLKMIKETEDSDIDAELVLSTISEVTPLDTFYTAISVSKENITLQGQTLSDIGLATLLAKTQDNELFESVTLENVSSADERSQAINFSMKLTLAK